MRSFIFFLLLVWNLGLPALQIVGTVFSEELNLQEMASQNMKTVTTEREGEQEKWQGFALAQILAKYTNYSKIVLSSQDGYQVELAKEEAEKAILALYKDGDSLGYQNRLLVPKKREMFWIKNVAKIKLKNETVSPPLQQIIVAENWLKEFSQPHPLPPFKNSSGYYFEEIARSILLFKQDEFQLIAADGVQHNLDYQKYLQNAILSQNGQAYDLQSPAMPGGMWLKQIAYIRVYDRALVFASQLKNWQDLKKLTGLKIEPKQVMMDGKKYNYAEFERLTWQNYKTIRFFY